MPVANSLSRRFGTSSPGPPGTTGLVAIVLLILALVFTLLQSFSG